MSKTKRNALALFVTLSIIFGVLPTLKLDSLAASNYKITGTVTYSDFTLSGVPIILYSTDGTTEIAKGITDDTGAYSIGFDEANDYILSVSASNLYYKAYSENISLNSDTVKDISLIKSPNAPDYFITNNSSSFAVNGTVKGTFAQALNACSDDINGDSVLKINFGIPGTTLNLPEVLTASKANYLKTATYTGNLTISDISGTSTHGVLVAAGSNVVFDSLKIISTGVTVTTGFYIVSVYGNLTINGSSEINASAPKATAINLGTAAALTVNGGSITSGAASYCIIGKSCGAVNVNQGTIAASNSSAISLTNATGDFTMTGGEIKADLNAAAAISSASTSALNLNGGSISGGKAYAVCNTSTGNININGATITSSGSTATVYNQNTGTVNMQSGSVTNTNGVGIWSDIYASRTACGDIKISGGSVTAYTCLNAEGNLSVYGDGTALTSAAGNAITCSGASIDPLKPALSISDGTISAGSSALIFSGKGLAIISDGSLSSSLKSKTTVSNNGIGTINITGGTISANNSSSIAVANASSGTLSISGGTVSADFANSVAVSNRAGGLTELTGGSFFAKNSGCVTIQNYGAGAMNISGGTVSADFAGGIALHNKIGGNVTISNGTFSSGGNCVRNDSLGIINITGGSFASTGTGTGAVALLSTSSGHISISGDNTQLKSTDIRTVILPKTATDDLGYIELFGTSVYSASKAALYIKGNSDSGKYSIKKDDFSSALLCAETLVTNYKLNAWTSDAARSNILVQNPTSITAGVAVSGLVNTDNKVFGRILPYPTATVNTAASVSAIEEKLSASVSANGYDTTVTFEYGLTNAYGSSADAAPNIVSGTTATPVTCMLSGLTPGKTYYYRAKCVSSTGAVTYSTGYTFATAKYSVSILPQISPITEENLEANALNVVLAGTTFKDGTFATGNFALTNAPAGVSIENIAYIDNTHCTVNLAYNGNDIDSNFKTFCLKIAAAELSCKTALTSGVLQINATVEISPSITTKDAESVTTNSAVLKGELKESGGEDVTAHGFVYSKSENPMLLAGTVLHCPFAAGVSLGTFETTLSGLESNTTYYFCAFATNSVGTSYGIVSNFTTVPTYIMPINSTDVIVDGVHQSVGTLNTVTDSVGRVTKTVTVDPFKLENILSSKGNGATILIPVSGSNDVAEGILSGDIVRSLELKSATLVVQTDNASYTLPASEIDINSISKQLGIDVLLSNIKVTVQISAKSAANPAITANPDNAMQYSVLVPAVDFTVSCEYQGISIEVNRFKAYVEREIAIPDGVDPNKITTGVVLQNDGTTYPVPTQVILLNGKYYAKMNSLTNSTYLVIEHPLEFMDLSSHWSKEAVNDMGSRMIVNGDGSGNYNPDKPITRAEFAAVIVRALGLSQGSEESSFSDVALDDWFNGYVDTATEYEIIKGYDSTSFGPNDKITREQAMTMLSRAMKITKLGSGVTDGSVTALLASYTDSATASSYAMESIAACINVGIVTGTSTSTVAPKSYVTRAEVAVMVSRLLKKSGLI